MISKFRYPNLLPYGEPLKRDNVSERFFDYQLLPNSVIPDNLRTSAKTGNNDAWLDVIWHFIRNMKTLDATLRFPRVSTIARLILSLPHSNPEEERVLSLVWQNKTCFRPNLDPHESLGSIITVKLAMDSNFPKAHLPKEVLLSSKKATWNYNKLHSKQWICNILYKKSQWEVFCGSSFLFKGVILQFFKPSQWASSLKNACQGTKFAGIGIP